MLQGLSKNACLPLDYSCEIHFALTFPCVVDLVCSLVLVFVFTDLGWAQGLAHGSFKHLVSWLRG